MPTPHATPGEGRPAEAALQPGLPIIDAHHHLRDRGGERYLAAEFLGDIVSSGHRVIATVAIETGYRHTEGGDPLLAPAGETAWLAEAAGTTRLAAAIVGFADLRAGDDARRVLQAHVEAGRGRFRGVRTPAAWHAQARFKYARADVPQGLLGDAGFRRGFAQLAPLGLSYDAWVYDGQLPELADLAAAFPETSIIVDHVGGPVSADAPLSARPGAFAEWQKRIADLARRPNVVVKLGGLGMPIMGFGFEHRAAPPSSGELAEAWRPYIETCIAAFGPGRCMFQSNFPPDRASCSYGVLWNAFKRMASPYSADEQHELFAGTASRVYRIDPVLNEGDSHDKTR
jgi:L-fuconolactonase